MNRADTNNPFSRGMNNVSATFAALCFSTVVLAAPTNHALREECSEFSQAGMRDCLAKKADESQQALTRAESNTTSALAKWDEDDKYVRAAKTDFANSNRAFAQYRSAQCKFSASLSGGGAGNAHEIQRFACVAELNDNRAEQLRAAASRLPRNRQQADDRRTHTTHSPDPAKTNPSSP
ncbi:lysozyme inhibitor LprI family protein [Caballeronia pedi]|uniref:lysozyme inhibitor LprI family protein n=1 Tax=Caballeronia pedi TaxID=1777141 RepID=UPI001FCA016A|nr:lysozyme inhibitor LprI family protein [Caballeronia pedi]